MPRALLSVSDKTGLVEFARGLAARGFELVSTGGTARALESAGLPVLGISDVTGFPEMMDGRVKTLHPLVHGGILARRGHAADLDSASEHGITLIDLVVVNLYPFVTAAPNPETPFDALIEEIDIGGPSLVRAAAKNFEDVLVVVSPADYDTVLTQLDRPGGPSREFRFELARRRSRTPALTTRPSRPSSTRSGSQATALPAERRRNIPRRSRLACGSGATCATARTRIRRPPGMPTMPQIGLGGAELLQGKELSYTNLLDLDAALRIVLEFNEPAAAVIKHTNPCGVAIGSRATDAYVRAREADPLSAFGAIVGLNRPIDVEAARAMVSTKIDAVIAPAVDEDARAVLAAKPNMRVVIADFDQLERLKARDVRSILGAVLVQDARSRRRGRRRLAVQ